MEHETETLKIALRNVQRLNEALSDRLELHEMANRERVIELVENITYKPGWTFAYAPDAWRGDDTVPMSVQATVLDVETGEPGVLGAIVHIDSTKSNQQITDWLIDHVDGTEHHETSEWFKVYGKVAREPHPEGAFATGPNYVDALAGAMACERGWFRPTD